MSRLLKILIAATFVCLLSCDAKEQKKRNEMTQKLPEDFDSFYDKFHSDSVFQMSRIKFPLEGMYRNGFEKINWTKENWTMLKVKIFDIDTTQYKTTYQKTDTTFTQRCYIEDSGFSTENKFKLVNNKWFLVYANDSNL